MVLTETVATVVSETVATVLLRTMSRLFTCLQRCILILVNNKTSESKSDVGFFHLNIGTSDIGHFTRISRTLLTSSNYCLHPKSYQKNRRFSISDYKVFEHHQKQRYGKTWLSYSDHLKTWLSMLSLFIAYFCWNVAVPTMRRHSFRSAAFRQAVSMHRPRNCILAPPPTNPITKPMPKP